MSIDLLKENGFKLAKERSRRYPTQTITNADYTDDIAPLANLPVQAESLLDSLNQTSIDIGLHMNVDKTEYMCLNQWGDISPLNGGPLKLVDKFTYLGTSVINQKWHQHATIKGMESYWKGVGNMEVRPDG